MDPLQQPNSSPTSFQAEQYGDLVDLPPNMFGTLLIQILTEQLDSYQSLSSKAYSWLLFGECIWLGKMCSEYFFVFKKV